MKRKIRAVVVGLCVALFLVVGAGCNKGKIKICTKTKAGECKCREWGKGEACQQENQCGEDEGQ